MPDEFRLVVAAKALRKVNEVIARQAEMLLKSIDYGALPDASGPIFPASSRVVQGTLAAMQTIEGSAKEITQIIGVIDGTAFQTMDAARSPPRLPNSAGVRWPTLLHTKAAAGLEPRNESISCCERFTPFASPTFNDRSPLRRPTESGGGPMFWKRRSGPT